MSAQNNSTGADNSSSDAPSSLELPPLPPTAGGATWIQLSSGEWLTGEIVRFLRGTLTFDSVQLGEQTFSFDEVRQIRSDREIHVTLEDGSVRTGRLFLDPETGRVIGDQDCEFARSEILSLIPARPGNGGVWSGELTAGINVRSGNTDELDFMARAEVERRSPTTRAMAEYLGNVSDTHRERTTENHRVFGGWARMASRRLFWSPLWGEFYRDPLSNIARRWTIGAGLGYVLMDSRWTDWEFTAGIAYLRTDFDSVVEDDEMSAETLAAVVATRYDIALTSRLDYSLDYRFSLMNAESGTYTHHFISGLEVGMVGNLDLDILLIWDRTEEPRQNADGSLPERDELQVVFGLGYMF